MDYSTTPYASAPLFHDLGFSMFPTSSKNELPHDLFEDKTNENDLAAFMKGNEACFFEKEKEEEVPKFYFPSLSMLKLGEKGDNSTSNSKDVQDRDIDFSVSSHKSTKAHYTKDNSMSFYYEFGYDLNKCSIEDKLDGFSSDDDLHTPIKIEQLPRLNQIFNNENDNNAHIGGFIAADQTKNQAEYINQQISGNKSAAISVAKVPTETPSYDVEKELDFIVAKSEPQTKVPTEPKDLSKRSDVVNKTILRSMKRYYFTEFDSQTGFSTLNDKEKFAQFHSLIKDFVMTEFKSIKGVSEQEIEDTIFFFGSMISQVHMRRGIKVSKLRTQVNFVHKCLYNYSHKKLSQLMNNGGFKQVLRDFVNFGGLDVVLNSEDTLAKNKEVYRSAADELLLSALAFE